MSLRNLPVDWQLEPEPTFIKVTYKGELVGFFTPEHAKSVVKVFNEEESLLKALRRACADLIAERNGNPSQVAELMKYYINNTKRPKYGTGAIAFLLKERKEELDINTQEFILFCESYKLSQQELREIHAGKKIDDSCLTPLSRILGKPVSELVAIRDGIPQDDDD